MGRLKVGIIFGGRSEEHPVSVKSAREVAKNLDTEKYEPFWIGITESGAWKLCDGPGANWENGSSRPAVLSPDRAARGLLVLGQGRYETIGLDVVLPVLHGKLGEDGAIQGLLELSGIPYAGCDVQGSVLCMDKSLAYIVARSAGIATPDFRAFTAAEDIDPCRARLSRLREAGTVRVVVRSQQGIHERRTAERGRNREAVRHESADRRGCRGQRGRMRRPGERHGPDCGRGRQDRPVSRLLQDPPGECTRKRLGKRKVHRSRRHSSRDALARPGDGEGRIPRPWMPGNITGGHVPQRRRDSSTQRGQHPAGHDLIQPLPENDGCRGAAAHGSDRPYSVACTDRKSR